MALNDIKVPKENAQGTFDETVLTAAEISAAPTSRSISAGSGLTGGGDLSANRTLAVAYGTTSGTACQGNDARLSDSRTPTAHAASHASAGSDPVFDQNLNTTDVVTFNEVNLTNLIFTGAGSISNSDQDASVTLNAGSVRLGGSIIETYGNLAVLDVSNGNSVKSATFDAQSNLTANRTYDLPDASGTLALTADIPSTFAASAITTGTLTHERGGLEADVSAYNGLVKISGGATSAVTVSTAGEALLDDVDAAAQRTTLGLGTASTSASTDFVAVSTIDAKGDLLVGTAADTVARLPVGATNGHVLTVDSAEASGMKWAAASGGSGGATNLWIPASAWIPRTTGGCGVDSREIGATNRANVDELLFDTGTEEFAQAFVVMPSNYNNSTITARFYWTASSGSGGVAWGISGRAYGDDDAIDQATGTRIVVTDTFITANDVHVTSATSAVTIAGTPAANKAVNFQISREVGNGSDTLGVDARLLGVEIIFN